jgi:hypothetical protein
LLQKCGALSNPRGSGFVCCMGGVPRRILSPQVVPLNYFCVISRSSNIFQHFQLCDVVICSNSQVCLACSSPVRFRASLVLRRYFLGLLSEFVSSGFPLASISISRQFIDSSRLAALSPLHGFQISEQVRADKTKTACIPSQLNASRFCKIVLNTP